MRRANAAVLGAVGALALVGAGCYGDTDNATSVGAHGAQLNFHGYANSGPAYSVVQYWRTADPANKLTTPLRNWPAGAQGSFGEQVQHLSEQSDYSFRLCGHDQGKWPPACASTRTFTTGRAVSTATFDSANSVAQFTSDPGVNDDLGVDIGGLPLRDDAYLAFFETFCAATTCGSNIAAGAGCTDVSALFGGGYSVAYCGYPAAAISIKLGDLDDTAYISDGSADLTLDGGSGSDSLVNASRGLTSTITGGTGQDVLTGSDYVNDTINARSATWLDPDTDKSISCRGGEDTVIADRSDPISAGQSGCEHVSKP